MQDCGEMVIKNSQRRSVESGKNIFLNLNIELRGRNEFAMNPFLQTFSSYGSL